MRVVVLGRAQVQSPPCDVCDDEALLLEHPHVLVGGRPDTQLIVCMMDEVHLPLGGQPGRSQERGRHRNGR